jgi:hypothetical protein
MAGLLAVSLAPASYAQPKAVPQPGCWFSPWGNHECLAASDPIEPLWSKAGLYCHYERRHDRRDSSYTYYQKCSEYGEKYGRDCRPVCTQWDDEDHCTHYANPCQQ